MPASVALVGAPLEVDQPVAEALPGKARAVAAKVCVGGYGKDQAARQG
ncbi:MAG: hypothetical protein WA970_23660 [Gammaproteobacteria bacterium]